MAHENALNFYRIVRTSPELWQDLAAAQDAETMIAKVRTLSAAHGMALSPEEVRAALADLPDPITATSDTGELSGDELELVAAGASDTGNKTRLNA